jgi:two-component system, OmpR family, response regulator
MATVKPEHAGRKTRLLVVDDEDTILSLLSMSLRFVGFEVRTARSGSEALEMAADFRPDLLVLDVMLPDLDGFEVTRRLRAQGAAAPVLFLTARDDINAKLTGLTIGGDDYVTKPFNLDEVIARVRVILCRVYGGGGQGEGVLRLADLELDEDTHDVRRAGQLIQLSPTEYRLLHYLLINAGRVVSKTQILEHVWHYDFGGDARIVESFVSLLRRKIDHVAPPLIHTMRGFGYALRLPPQ